MAAPYLVQFETREKKSNQLPDKEPQETGAHMAAPDITRDPGIRTCPKA